MGLIYPLAALLGLEVDVLVSRLRQNAITLSVVAFFGVVGVVFLLVAAFIALADAVGPVFAALIMAASAFVLALLVYAIGTAMVKANTRRQAARKRSGEATALMTSAAVAAAPLVPALLRSPVMRGIVLPAAAVAAIALYLRSADKRDG